MANLAFNLAKRKLLDGTLDLDTNTIKLILIKSSFPTDPDIDDITELLGTAVDECDATNYTGGPGGSGRKTVTLTASTNTTNDRGDIAISADQTWTALGGASNNTITGAVLYQHNSGSDDSQNIPICAFDITDTATNGGDFTLQWPTDGATARCLIKLS